MSKVHAQYGCGLSGPKEWVNFDSSPTLQLQRIPLIGKLFYSFSSVKFPENIKYGDIIKGLPLAANSCDSLYCSHVLEHLSLEDFRIALKNSYHVLKPGGIFRCVLPDLEYIAKTYLEKKANRELDASITFMNWTLLGHEKREKGLKAIVKNHFSNAHHLWMWDKDSLAMELEKVGFKNIRKASFNDSQENAFKLVEDSTRFENAVAIESIK
ncbi:MAG: methyltransferase domain-containing protein [Sphingobacteriaceae bacterium]|nr:methyltransferase domain-containing protein [Sphingobacteriaceae bacterium]